MKRGLWLLAISLYVASLVVFFRLSGEKKSGPERPRTFILPLPKAQVALQPPAVAFRDITQKAQIRFVHEVGAQGDFLFPEILGPGCGFLDFDNDGDQDILIVNSGVWPHRQNDPALPTVVHSLYRNDGQGRFDDVGKEMGLSCRSYGQGLCFGDVDNDGYTDIYITCVGPNVLFRNDRGQHFIDVTAEAGVECPEWSVSAAFLDYDRDGLLDLFVGNFVQWSLEAQRTVQISKSQRADEFKNMPDELARLFQYGPYGPPHLYEGNFCRLYRNQGGLHFQDVSAEAGIRRKERGERPAAKALGVAVCDYNDDGWPDIAVANDSVQNFLFRNFGKGTFRDIATEVGVATDFRGAPRSGMGLAWADYRNDHSIALAVANFAGELLGLYLSQDPGRQAFADVSIPEGVGASSRPGVMWGVFFFDYDLDGRLDLFVLNGHVHSSDAQVQNISYKQKPVLFWNRGRGSGGAFLPVGPTECGEDLFLERIGRGAAYGDIDNDGDLDMLLTSNMGPAALLRNEGGHPNRSLRLQLTGTRSNRSAIGAKIRVRTGDSWQRREITSGSSYASQSEFPATFGLGIAHAADEIEITWPSGLVQTFRNVPASQTVRIIEGEALTSP